ncbi:MAG: hypothetical protein ABR562_09790, partial [Thermoplasmatota archaeon]
MRLFLTSTTTVFERPWLKLCLTLPVSTVRFSPSGTLPNTVVSNTTKQFCVRAHGNAGSSDHYHLVLLGLPTGAVEAGQDLGTLHVRMDALRAAVAPYRSVAGLEVSTDFPHRMRIEVLERRLVAVLQVGDQQLPATGSGLVLQGEVADRD